MSRNSSFFGDGDSQRLSLGDFFQDGAFGERTLALAGVDTSSGLVHHQEHHRSALKQARQPRPEVSRSLHGLLHSGAGEKGEESEANVEMLLPSTSSSSPSSSSPPHSRSSSSRGSFALPNFSLSSPEMDESSSPELSDFRRRAERDSLWPIPSAATGNWMDGSDDEDPEEEADEAERGEQQRSTDPHRRSARYSVPAQEEANKENSSPAAEALGGRRRKRHSAVGLGINAAPTASRSPQLPSPARSEEARRESADREPKVQVSAQPAAAAPRRWSTYSSAGALAPLTLSYMTNVEEEEEPEEEEEEKEGGQNRHQSLPLAPPPSARPSSSAGSRQRERAGAAPGNPQAGKQHADGSNGSGTGSSKRMSSSFGASGSSSMDRRGAEEVKSRRGSEQGRGQDYPEDEEQDTDEQDGTEEEEGEEGEDPICGGCSELISPESAEEGVIHFA